jgi:MFS transporter, Spinster family, sphingosine-1-phosphate transporter
LPPLAENKASISKYSYYVLSILFAANLLNYIDRQVIYAVFPLIRSDLQLSDTALGSLGSAFMICYMVAAPFFGWIGDRFRRARLAASGLVIWSFATAAAGFSGSYGSLLAARTMVGIGEASFGTVSPGLLADFFVRAIRGRILSLFYLAIPVGSALGYLLGGLLGQNFGWHAAFLVVGIPGLFLALPLLMIREPVRGASDGIIATRQGPASESYRRLFSNRSFVFNTASMTAMTFALGGLAQWVPSFLNRVHGLDVASGNIMFGLVTIAAGISGTLAGGWAGDWLQKRNERGYLYLTGCGFLVAAPVMIAALLAGTPPLCLAFVFAAEFFLFLSTGPQNTVIVNVTAPGLRATAFALNIFVIHALGDAISPLIIGILSDASDLGSALLITPAAVLLAAAFSFYCAKFIQDDTGKVRA